MHIVNKYLLVVFLILSGCQSHPIKTTPVTTSTTTVPVTTTTAPSTTTTAAPATTTTTSISTTSTSTTSTSTTSTTTTSATTTTLPGFTVTWTQPTERADGTPLALSEIGGYWIYYGRESGNYTESVDIGNSGKTSATIPETGINYVVMTTYDTDGRESIYSQEIVK